MLPKVGCAEGAGDSLIVVQVDPVVLDVSSVVRVEQELRRVPVLALGHRVGDIGISGEASGGVGGGELRAIDFALGIVERLQNERLAKEAIIEQIGRASCRERV